MRDAAAEHAESTGEDPGFSRAEPQVAHSPHRGAIAEATWALFEPTVTAASQIPAGDDAASSGDDCSPALLVSLSELRRHVALQAGQLERAMEEVQMLGRRLEASRARGVAAERAVARERALRARQARDSARRLDEHERTIAALSAELRKQRQKIAGADDQTVASVERRLERRQRLDEQVADVIATARTAIAETRIALERRESRITNLHISLNRERERRLAAERRLDDAPARERPWGIERRKVLQAAGPAGVGAPAGVAPSGTRPADVAAACRKLEQELAARHALEVRAARLIGRLNHQLGVKT